MRRQDRPLTWAYPRPVACASGTPDESELPDSADDLLLLQALFREESPAEVTGKVRAVAP